MEESTIPQEAATQGTAAETTTKKDVMDTVLGTAVSLALLFGMVWVISKAWKAGQKPA